jgi:hypothetical protein
MDAPSPAFVKQPGLGCEGRGIAFQAAAAKASEGPLHGGLILSLELITDAELASGGIEQVQ